MRRLFYFGKYHNTGGRFLYINDGNCPHFSADRDMVCVAVRLFHHVYVTKWERGKGVTFERNRCYPRWISPLLAEVSNARMRLAQCEKQLATLAVGRGDQQS